MNFLPFLFLASYIAPFPMQESSCANPFPQPLVVEAGKKQDFQQQIISQSKVLEQRLNRYIFGQEAAVKETSNAILRYAAGVNDPNTPVASLLYCGPSGVGKTELAKQLCVALFNDSSHFIRINMAEYTEPHSISRLIGSPPGYIGYDEGGQLANRLLATPNALVLLDEIEKAHPKILKMFLHVFDAGYFTSSSGRDIDCRDAIFILTSNLSACEIADLHEGGMSKEEILVFLQPKLMDALSPELFNRLDCMIFSPLSQEVLAKLITKMLRELNHRVQISRNIEVLFDPSIVEYLMTYTLDPKLGARPLKRLIDKELATVIAKAIIHNECVEEEVLLCSYADGCVIIETLFEPLPA